MRRRRILQCAGAGVCLLAGCSSWSRETDTPTADPSPAPTTSDPAAPVEDRTEQLASRFGSVIDAVEAGCDPAGESPCGPEILDAAGDDTLLVFPSGEYRIDERITLSELENFGIRGDAEDAVFVAPPDFNEQWLIADRGQGLVFENVTIDVRAANSAPTVKLGVTDGLEVRDVEIVGRGMRTESKPGSGGNVPVGTAFLPVVRSPDGEGIVERFVAKTGGRIGTYNGGEGRVGIYIGQSNQGRIRLVDCHLEEFGNNGVYASRTHGTVEVVGGTFRNNDISQVRLGSEGSFVEGATIEVDVEDVGDPNAPGDYMNPRGVRIESGPLDTAGVTVRDVDVHLKNSPSGAIVVGDLGGHFRVEDTDIRIDNGNGAAILAKPPTGGFRDPPPEPHHGTITGVTVTGEPSARAAIRLIGRPGSTIEDTVIDNPNGQRNGILLTDSPASIADTRVVAGGYPLIVRGDASASDCVVTLEGVRLESTGVDEGRLLVFPSQPALRSPYRPSGTYCAPGDLLRDAPVDGAPVVRFSGTRLDGLYGEFIPAREFDIEGG